MLKTITENGFTIPFKYRAAQPGNIFAFFGEFDSAILAIQASYDSGESFITLERDGEIFQVVEPSIYQINVGRCFLRFNVSNAGPSTEIKVNIA
jgi:hypothetical protein